MSDKRIVQIQIDMSKRIKQLEKKLEIAVSALKHPDINELTCECGWYEPEDPDGDGKHCCIKCTIEDTLKQIGEV